MSNKEQQIQTRGCMTIMKLLDKIIKDTRTPRDLIEETKQAQRDWVNINKGIFRND